MTEENADEEEMLKWAKGYANKQGWELNTDQKQLSTVIRGLCGTKRSSEGRTAPAVSGAGMRRKTWRLNVPACSIKMKFPAMDIAIATSILKRTDHCFYKSNSPVLELAHG